ncbi:hypothetical protein FGIG_07605 [Fasciola gigantica]|uniref:Uncharacterized protein n=1 Tax=Fasciola gigantica TaxID=46835 RepID=A0A504YP99_FASGI|nr:hypothetical protein FGIG_07605 [Fasciola gigantica]
MVAMPVTLVQSPTEAVKSLRVLKNQATLRMAPISIPNKFRSEENCHQWKGQVRRYLKNFPTEQQAGLLLSLLEEAAYDRFVDSSVVNEIMSGASFDKLCETLNPLPPGLLLTDNGGFIKRGNNRAKQC